MNSNETPPRFHPLTLRLHTSAILQTNNSFMNEIIEQKIPLKNGKKTFLENPKNPAFPTNKSFLFEFTLEKVLSA